MSKISAVIVTHNSEIFLPRCLKYLHRQENKIEQIVIVDSGSADVSYLNAIEQEKLTQLLYRDNIGFARANNIGFEALDKQSEYVLFLNPDVFLPSDFVRKSIELLSSYNPKIILSGKLAGFDSEQNKATGLLDSTGLNRTIYGRWFDRGQGEVDQGQYNAVEAMPGLCGALLVCRVADLHSLGTSVFDEDFFLYKEDIELSLRLRKNGWQFLYHPDLLAYHCRGWQGERGRMSYFLRKTAAESELLLYKKHPSPYIAWAWLKFVLVSIFRI